MDAVGAEAVTACRMQVRQLHDADDIAFSMKLHHTIMQPIVLL
jgi:hypothetical protein